MIYMSNTYIQLNLSNQREKKMTDYCLTMLRILFYLGRVGKETITVNKILSCMPVAVATRIRDTITDLVRLEFIEKTPDDRISIRRERRDDVCRLMDPEPDPAIKSIKPIEDTIPKSFDKTPFLVTEGGHKVKGVVDKYAFHKNKFDSSIIVYLVSDNQKKSTIKLGNLTDRTSLYRRALLGIDSKFGTNVFTKAMMNQLGSVIVGNRQPTKALIDIMIFDGYIIQIDDKHFMRTSKNAPLTNGLIIER